MSRFWSPVVERLVPYTPGEQPKGGTFIKLNTNENPYGPSPRALEAIRASTDGRLRLYPDPAAADLAQAIGAGFGLGPENVFLGNGSDEVLAHAFHAFFAGRGPILFPDVTYSFYRSTCALYGIEYREIALDDSFRTDPADWRAPCGGMVIANPNAPTGIALPLAALRQILAQAPDTLVLVDEAYVDFGGASAAGLVAEFDNLLVVQTFSKSRSLAGLRVGFALGQPPLIEALRRIKDSFNSYPLGHLALAGALAAWEDRAWFEQTRAQVMAERGRMAAGLAGQGFQVLPSATNFLFASHAALRAETLLADLRAQGILVRHFTAPRIRNWLRISVGTAQDGDALLQATARIAAARA
ncbi:histidinol-phosphate transaminase [Frigidibacter mobilis]|uniref:Histidinol-phosphate aminotransferase n=1 Tax=Frigidibacter mobilis TaxID=1335048 RepID=A0A159Z4A6_9RHOB|nr:histidinol-phosphate transaminase [Frigidibacter mobilis]AMY69956.1 histidinol-phosphate aminotransferase [Frigidibacter mobilis]